MAVSPEQIRAARALLHLGQDELARRAHLSVVTIRRIESAQRTRQVAPETLGEVQRVLEVAGAEFIKGGVRRRRSDRSDRPGLFAELKAISQRSAERLRGREMMSDADLYDENGLPV